MIFDEPALEKWRTRLHSIDVEVDGAYPGDRQDRQPVHTVYESAHLYTPARPRALGDVALEAMERHGSDPDTFARALGLEASPVADQVHRRVIEKLETDPVEDLRLDFEDGYRGGGDDVEDDDAASAGAAMATAMEEGSLPGRIGLRVESLGRGLHRRSLRTLELVVSAVVERAGALPAGFRVTLPKITAPEQVEIFAEALELLESRLGLSNAIPVELMVETPQLVVDRDGVTGMRRQVEAGGGRVVAAHLGAYDYTTALDIAAAHQGLANPVAEYARQVMKASLAGTGIWLSDGSTNAMPIGEREAVWAAWRQQFAEVRRAMRSGFYQGWDLHGAQLPARFAAVYSFFSETIDDAASRLATLIADGATTAVGAVYDDPATGESLLRFVRRAIGCGAVDAVRLEEATGLSSSELAGGSLTEIVAARR